MSTGTRPAPSGAQASTAVQRHTRNQSTAVAALEAKREEIFNAVSVYADEIKNLAPRGTTPAMYVASLRLYLIRNPKVLDCTPASIAQGMLRVAQTGLNLGEGCDLLPFKETCQFQPRYNGLVELAIASGVRSLNADVVREGDFFEWEKGTSTFLRHKRLAPDSAKITHAYAVAEIKANSCVLEVIPIEHVEKTRAKFSKQWKDGAIEDIPWYARKTAVRRLASLLPKNPRFAAALAFAEAEDLEEIPEAEVTQIETAAGDGAAQETNAVGHAPPERAPAPQQPARATEDQIERLLDLIHNDFIPAQAREKVEARLKEGLSSQLAATWIEALDQQLRKHAAPSGDDDSLGL